MVGSAPPIETEPNPGGHAPTAAPKGFVLQPFRFPLDNGRLTFPPAAQPPRSESPAFSWEGAPAGTRSFALVFRERSLDLVEWVLWDIPSSYTAVPPGIRAVNTPTEVPGSSQAGAVFDGYAGPLLSGEYQFELWALDVDRLPRGRMRSVESIAFEIMPRHVIEVTRPVRVFYEESRPLL